jgi:hypothetical protein
MIKKTFLLLLMIVAGFCVYIATQPDEFTVERSATIAAAPDAVFPHVNNLRNWNAWSPWAKLDPDAKNTFEGPSEGSGAVFSWSGNDKVGEGKMTITDSIPSQLIRIQLDFIKPFPSTATSEFKFEAPTTPSSSETKVTWTMRGKNNFLGRAVCFFMNMDKVIGGQFEQGLGDIKRLAEAK